MAALNQGLQKRQQAAKVKALLQLMQDTAHVMSKVMYTMTTVNMFTRWLLHAHTGNRQIVTSNWAECAAY